jgi:predicted DNA-binding transcriptional regulator AlpA
MITLAIMRASIRARIEKAREQKEAVLTFPLVSIHDDRRYITVKEIAAKHRINRSTAYRHIMRLRRFPGDVERVGRALRVSDALYVRFAAELVAAGMR